MVGDWAIATVTELQEAGVLLVEDGNHGENRPRPDEFNASGEHFVRAADMNNGRIDFDRASRINEVARQRVRKGVGASGDVLLSHKGTVGKVALVPDDAPPFVCSPQTTFWRSLDTERLNCRYLWAFLSSPGFRNQLASRAGETDMAPYVSLTSQRGLVVTLPPIGEQRAIAHILGTLDDKIELNRRMNETLEQMARALFKSWFVDFDPVRAKAEGRDPGLPKPLADLFPDSFEDSELGEIPEGWSVGPLGEFLRVGLGGAWGKDHATESAPIAVRCLRGIDCHDLAEGRLPEVPMRYLSRKQQSDRALNDGNILVEGSGSFCGRSLLWRSCYEALLGSTVAYSNFCKRLDPVCSASQASICWLQMRRAYAEGRMQAFRTGTAFPNLDVHGLLSGMTIVMPPTDLTDCFQAFLTASQRTDLTTQSATLAALRDTLLPKLISGEIRVKDADRFLDKVTA